MPSLPARVRRFAARHGLWSPGTRVLAAVSGGSDSVALLLLLQALGEAHGVPCLAGVAHVNHHLRDEADGDEGFVRELAGSLQLPIEVAHVDVPALAARHGRSIEVAAREARHAALAAAAAALGADRIATAHTLDDQAETVLMRLVRGAGPGGLGGIDPRRGPRIRPLLAETRASLQAWLVSAGRAWREDATNRDLQQPRNRIRHELVPYLAAHFNPSVSAALARAADIARADEQYLADVARAAAEAIVTRTDEGVALDRDRLAALAPGIARRVARLALETAHPAGSYGLSEADRVVEAAGAGPGRLDLPGLRMERIGGRVVLVHGARRAPARAAAFAYECAVPGRVAIPEAGAALEAEGPVPVGRLERGPDAVSVDAAALGGRLVVRSRAPGDRLRPLGLGGRKKLQDLFVDGGVSRPERDRTPVVTDAGGRIVWVAGLALGEEFRVTSHTNAVVVLRLRRF
ncbi:MAG: tRNA lysidine(34) synthetase TilS [Vicinamibacterales bacterium]